MPDRTEIEDLEDEIKSTRLAYEVSPWGMGMMYRKQLADLNTKLREAKKRYEDAASSETMEPLLSDLAKGEDAA